LNAEAPKIIVETELYNKVVAYLEKRPCWLKNSLYYALYQDGMKGKYTINDFKNVMKYLAFTYKNGPWKHTFCKFGFDPKK
jgi:general transcription factor 3C polypeptide 5 (transcription factor C subunit 1)